MSLKRAYNHMYAAMHITHCVILHNGSATKAAQKHLHTPPQPNSATCCRQQKLKQIHQKRYDSSKKIKRRCDPCQQIHNTLTRSRVSLDAKSTKFNEKAYLDIMYMDSKPVLHLVDEATRFSAAKHTALSIQRQNIGCSSIILIHGIHRDDSQAHGR